MSARWASRCLPAFSIIALLALLVQTTEVISLPRNISHSDPPGYAPRAKHLTVMQHVFIIYTVLIHLNMLGFTTRLAWALFRAPLETTRALNRRSVSKMDGEYLDSPTCPSASLPDPSTFKTDALKGDDGPEPEVIHAIILPNYSEDIDTLRTTLSVLANHPRARFYYEVYLAMEQKEVGATNKAMQLMQEYEKSFLHISSTFHPPGLAGEIPGKSSNVAFAARHIAVAHKEELDDGVSNVLITVMDADTHLLRDYFTEIRRLHYTYSTDAERTIYSCPIIFDRNSHETPTMVRCADLLWGFAGLSTMYLGSSISIPTSVYSLPLTMAERVGGWDSDATAIGEDMHMMLKCYFGTATNVVSRVVYVPASQCNISSDSTKGWRRTTDTYKARYRQALRHMWGALDSGFAVRQTVSSLRFQRRCLFLRLQHIALLHLLFEAHFLPCHLIILMLYSAVYENLAPAGSLHPTLAWAFWLTNIIRTSSFVGMNICLALYERWHALCLNARRTDMLDACLGDTGFSPRVWWHMPYLLERICFPIAGTLFGPIPTFQAVFSHLWTDRLEYQVSKKPTFAVASMV
ncbi:hypothetical protein FE257_003938 [Aspergillus nanangensis]|uniref:Glycosyltransferase 2-like domain-containing protein n=1 Tax=Aspergillus nanangensis TaxID=2582783 RepID=A0AAD4CS56_ASPNN|nr:hypothetical protein FE257_003938 [Aspergillus nanangensis]